LGHSYSQKALLSCLPSSQNKTSTTIIFWVFPKEQQKARTEKEKSIAKSKVIEKPHKVYEPSSFPATAPENTLDGNNSTLSMPLVGISSAE
jgi:hypothetical protein